MLNSVKRAWAEFREFAFKGNMIDLAIAVVIGGAFSGVIHSLVDDVIMPAVTYVTTTAQKATKVAAEGIQKASAEVGLTTTQPSTQASTGPSTQPTVAVAVTVAPPTPPVAAAPATPATSSPPADEKQVQLDWTIGPIKIGHFIASLINFLLVAFAVFLVMVKVLGSLLKRVSAPVAASEPTTKQCPYCLSDIPIKARKCAHCTSELPAVS